MAVEEHVRQNHKKKIWLNPDTEIIQTISMVTGKVEKCMELNNQLINDDLRGSTWPTTCFPSCASYSLIWCKFVLRVHFTDINLIRFFFWCKRLTPGVKANEWKTHMIWSWPSIATFSFAKWNAYMFMLLGMTPHTGPLKSGSHVVTRFHPPWLL